MPINRLAVKNILVVRNDRFGEFLLNIPALRALKGNFTNTRLIAVVNPYVAELAGSLPFIDEIIGWGPLKHSLPQKLNLAANLKRKDIDIAIMLNPSREFNIISFLAGIPVRVGYNRKWGFLLTHKMKDEKYLGRKHEIEYNLDLVGLLGINTENESLSLNIEDCCALPEKLGAGKGSDLVAIHPWTSDPIKQWPIDNFVELTRKLAQDKDAKIIIIGGKEESLKSRHYFTNLKSNVIDYTGKTTLKELAALLKKCRLLISGDSGPVHLACCVGTCVIAIFRKDIPGKCAKRWGPWGEGHIVMESNSLNEISPDTVFLKAKEKLNK